MINAKTKEIIQEELCYRMGDYFEKHFDKLFSFVDYRKKQKTILRPVLNKYFSPEEYDFIEAVSPIVFLSELMSDDLFDEGLDNLNVVLIIGEAKGAIRISVELGKFRPLSLDLYTITVTKENELILTSILGESKKFDMNDTEISQKIIEYVKTDGLVILREERINKYILLSVKKQMEELLSKFAYNPVMQHYDYDIPLNMTYNPAELTFDSISEQRVIDFHIFVNNEYHFDFTKSEIDDVLAFAEGELSVLAEKIGLQQKIKINKENHVIERL